MSATPEIKRDPQGHRYVRVSLGRDEAGRAIRSYHRFEDELTDEECEAELGRWLAGSDAAARLGLTTRVGDQGRAFVRSKEASGAATRTVRAYAYYLRKAEALWNRDAREVDTADATALYWRLLNEEGLSPSTVLGVHHFLVQLWGWMGRNGVVTRNPIVAAAKPSEPTQEATALDEADAVRLSRELQALAFGRADTPRQAAHAAYAFLAWLVLNTGLRRGEACALRGCDLLHYPVNDRWYLRVSGTIEGGTRREGTKGHRARKVSLGHEVAELVARFAGIGDDPTGPLVPVGGSWPDPDGFERWFRALCRRLGMPEGTTLHTLRHTHASLLLAVRGFTPRIVQERLGHASIKTTLGIYGHLMPGADEQAADAIDELLHEDGGAA